MARCDFDTILFPVNCATWHAGNFGPQVLAKAQGMQEAMNTGLIFRYPREG